MINDPSFLAEAAIHKKIKIRNSSVLCLCNYISRISLLDAKFGTNKFNIIPSHSAKIFVDVLEPLKHSSWLRSRLKLRCALVQFLTILIC